jgi:hypothetical protein
MQTNKSNICDNDEPNIVLFTEIVKDTITRTKNVNIIIRQNVQYKHH